MEQRQQHITTSQTATHRKEIKVATTGPLLLWHLCISCCAEAFHCHNTITHFYFCLLLPCELFCSFLLFLLNKLQEVFPRKQKLDAIKDVLFTPDKEMPKDNKWRGFLSCYLRNFN